MKNTSEDKNRPKNIVGQETPDDLPGYPHYPRKEDIMNPQNGLYKLNADEELANSKRLSSRVVNEKKSESDEPDEEDNDAGIVSGTEADVTADDLESLGDRDADQDMGDDELPDATSRVDELDEEEDLDIPGAELDNKAEDIGAEDEENNYYSLGGERHEDLEEDPS